LRLDNGGEAERKKGSKERARSLQNEFICSYLIYMFLSIATLVGAGDAVVPAEAVVVQECP
jgi:hypothetical protein